MPSFVLMSETLEQQFLCFVLRYNRSTDKLLFATATFERLFLPNESNHERFLLHSCFSRGLLKRECNKSDLMSTIVDGEHISVKIQRRTQKDIMHI